MKTFSVTRVALALLPVILRKPVVLAIFRSALSGLQSEIDTVEDTHNGDPDGQGSAGGTYYRLAHSGQVCSLEALLNDCFDPSARRIVINDGNDYERWYVYPDAFLRANPQYKTQIAHDPSSSPLHPDADYVKTSSTAFVINLPSSLQSSEPLIRQRVDDTRIAGVTYIFNYKD